MSFIRIIITFNAVLTSYCQNIEDLWLIGPEIIFLACKCGVKIAWQFSKFSNAISRKFWKTHIAAFCSQVHVQLAVGQTPLHWFAVHHRNIWTLPKCSDVVLPEPGSHKRGGCNLGGVLSGGGYVLQSSQDQGLISLICFTACQQLIFCTANQLLAAPSLL